VHQGDPVHIRGEGDSSLKLDATITRIAHALDPRTRTMLAEIDIDNPEGAVYPGLFVHVSLNITAPTSLSVPSEAVFLRAGLPFVAVIDKGRARYAAVRLGDDDGKTIRILEGLEAGQLVGLHIGDDVSDGAPVQPVEPAAPAPLRKP
jgi:multidrug efflux pump subunit AcrA (membrane-fusion protein)